MLHEQIDAITALRLKLRANGYSPIPVLGKRPLLPEWQKMCGAGEAEITDWGARYPGGVNTGILTKDTTGVDIDILIAPAADAAEDVVREWFDGRGVLLCRFGNAPKRALLFRTSTPFGKLAALFRAPNGSFHKVEILGDGQQLVVDGVHPGTGRPYKWARDQSPVTTPRADLPEINEVEAQELLDLVANVLRERFGFERINGRAIDVPTETYSPSVDVETRLANIHFGDIHDAWRDCVGSLLRKGMRADDVYRKLLSATEGSPACQGDPQKKLWGRRLLDMLASYMRHERAFVANLSPEMQKVWHKHDRAGTKIQFVFRNDLGCTSGRRITKTRSPRNSLNPRRSTNLPTSPNPARGSSASSWCPLPTCGRARNHSTWSTS
jgi:Bifunctional DNA primase/polymerase, N-terminal